MISCRRWKASFPPVMMQHGGQLSPLISAETLLWQAGNICQATHTQSHIFFSWILTVQSHIVVGEDGRFVSLGCPADHHVQHSIRGLDIMFLRKNTQTRPQSPGGSHTVICFFVRTFTPGSFLGKQKPQWFRVSRVSKCGSRHINMSTRDTLLHLLEFQTHPALPLTAHQCSSVPH